MTPYWIGLLGKFCTFTPGNVISGGSVILIRTQILGRGTSIEHEENFPGRDHVVRIRQLDCNCTIIELHYQPDGTLQELRQLLRAAAARWPTYPDGLGFLVGDFNIYNPDEGRFNPQPGLQRWRRQPHRRPPHRLSSRSVELAQPNFTQRDERRDGSLHTRSRIDRIFVNLPMVDSASGAILILLGPLVEILCQRPHTGPLTFDCSRTKQQDHPAIWRWLVQHPLFINALDEEHRNTVHDADPFVALEQLNEVVLKAWIRPNRLSFLALRLLLGKIAHSLYCPPSV